MDEAQSEALKRVRMIVADMRAGEKCFTFS